MKVLGVRPGNDLIYIGLLLYTGNIPCNFFCDCCNAGRLVLDCLLTSPRQWFEKLYTALKITKVGQGRTVLQYKLYIKSFPITADTRSTQFPYSPACWILRPNLWAEKQKLSLKRLCPVWKLHVKAIPEHRYSREL